MTAFRKQKGRGSPRPLNDPAALPEESQNAVGHLVGLGEHGGAGLLEDLVAQHVGGFHRVVGIHDGAVLGGGIDSLGTQRGGSRREGRHVGTVLGAGGNDLGDGGFDFRDGVRVGGNHGDCGGCAGNSAAGDKIGRGIGKTNTHILLSDRSADDLNQGAIKVTQKLTADKNAKVADMFRFGMQVQMPDSYVQSIYYGRGPVENYVDRNNAAFIGKYKQNVDEQFYSYIRPQETGTKTDIRWWKQVTKGGFGLQFTSDAAFSASALNYSIASLDDGVDKDQRHPADVDKAGYTNLCIDKMQMGLGCVNSWGALPLEKYRLPYGDYEFNFLITPVK